MEKYYFEEEWKEAVLLTKENKPTVLVLDGEEVEICCPEIGRGMSVSVGHHALFQRGKAQMVGDIQ